MPDRRINVVLSASYRGLRAGLARASADVRRFGDDVNRAARDTSLHGDRIGRTMLVMSAAIVAAFGLGVYAAAQFEREMRNVATISPLVRNSFDEASNAIIDMSTRLPQSAATLARGLYDVASSGFAGAEGLTVTEQSAKAASAGLTDTATAARAITGVMNAYGLKAQDARMVSDILFQTVNLGVVTFEELAQQIGDVVGTASAAEIPVKDLGTAIATITLAGIPAAEATTSLNRVVQSLLDPSDALYETLRELGYVTGEQALESDGLQKVLTRVRNVTGDNTTAFLQLFPEIRAARGALALTAAEGENWRRVARGMDDATRGSGATARALAEQQKALTYQFTLAKNAVMAVAITMGQGLLPPLKFVASAARQVFLGFREMPGPLRIVLQIAGALGAVVLALGGGFLVLAPRLRDAQAFLNGLGRSGQIATTGLKGLSLALGVVGIALTVYAAIQGAGAQKQQEINDKANKYLDILRQTNGELDKAASAEARRNLAQADAVSNARELGITGRELVRTLKEQNAVDIVASRSRANGIRLLREQGFTQKEATLAFDQAKTSTDQVTAAWVRSQPAARKLIDSRRSLIDAVDTERESIKRAIEIYKQETDTKDQSKKKSQEQKQALKEEEEALAALGAQVDAAGGEISELTEVQKALHDVIKDGPNPMAAYNAALQTWRENNDINMDGASDAWWRFNANATLALTDFLNELEAQNTALANWETNLGEVARRGGVNFALQLAKLGPEAAPLVAQIATATQPEFDRAVLLFTESARRMGEGHASELDKYLKISAVIGSMGGQATGQAIADATGIKLPEVERIAAQYGITLLTGVNTVLNSLTGQTVAVKPAPLPPSAYAGFTSLKKARGDVMPHIANTPTILFGERETGGEAFIPLGKHIRARSEKLLMQVANMFGMSVVPMALGGINDYIGRIPKVPNYPPWTADRGGLESDRKKYAHAVFKVAQEYAKAQEREASMTRGGGLASTVGINPEFLRRYNEYNAAVGNKFRIVSGYRSSAQQAVLYQKYLAGQGNLAAPPGRSQHEKGLAIDHSPNASAGDMAVARQFRLHYPVRGEPWHVEPFDRGGYLRPGWTMAYNGTGRPERVLGPHETGITINAPLHIHGNFFGDDHLKREIQRGHENHDRQLARAVTRKRPA